MPYNPFAKALGETLQADDLQALITQQVAEGYFIEYKREMPSTLKIARSLASFANTYGGWYIVGIETNQHNVATAVPGFDPSSCADPISVVRELVKHYIDPIPLFFPQVIMLPTGNLVLAVYIPEHQETPFITKDGRVYRRTNDSSDPVPETSRYALDQLIERGRAVSEYFESFSQDKRTFSQSEKDGWLKMYISPYPFGIIERFDLVSAPTIADLLAWSKEPIQFPFGNADITISGNIPFTAAYPTTSSVVLRQTQILDEALNSLTLELDIYGRAKLVIPLPSTPLESWEISSIRSSIVRQKLLERTVPQNSGSSRYLRLFNIGKIWLSVASLVNFYLKWLNTPVILTHFQIALELEEVWRFVPFYDFDPWGYHVDQFGMPVLMHKKVRIPWRERVPYIVKREADLWLPLCIEVGLAFGFPQEFTAKALGQILVDASTRKQ